MPTMKTGVWSWLPQPEVALLEVIPTEGFQQIGDVFAMSRLLTT
jgi:hypothetical protein